MKRAIAPAWQIETRVDPKLDRTIEIDTEVARFVLDKVKGPGTLPGKVVLETAQYAEPGAIFTLGTAQRLKKGWGSHIRLGLHLYHPDDDIAFQSTAVHELKHAADYCNPKAMLEHHIWHFKSKSRELQGKEAYDFENSPFEIAARQAEISMARLSLPPIVVIT